MKRIATYALIFVLGGISGLGVYYATFGAADRARIVALEAELKSKNEKIDKCTDALINLHTNTPQVAPSVDTGPK